MAKNYFGVVLTTKEHDKYRLVVYRYKDPGILNTCPMRQLLRAIHKFQQEYTEIHREHCSRIPPRKWYELGRVMPSIVLRKYGLEKHYEMSFEPSRVPPASALKLSTPGEAYDAMREDYLNELKSRGLEDNGSSNDDGESCPGGYIISDEAQIYDFAQYTPYEQLLPAVLFGVHRIG